MKFVLAPFGSRGDVDPLIALGNKLAARGHRVLFCAPPNFREVVSSRGVEFRSTGTDFRQLFAANSGNARLFDACLREAPDQFKVLAEAAEGADMIVGAALQFAARTVAEMLRIQYRYVVFSPMYLRSTRLPAFWSGRHRVPALLGRVSWALEDARQLRGAGWLNAERQRLGLQPVKSLHMHLLGAEPVLGAFDPVIAPLALDGIEAVVAGYWRSSDEAQLSPDVEDFVAASGDAKPVYVGFGSMAYDATAALAAAVTRGLLDAGFRVVLARGWTSAGVDFQSKDCLVLDEAPHDILFPRMAAVVHHGGAGTTASVACAGAPQVLVPHLGDQFYHGGRVADLGIGPEAIPLRAATSARVVAAVRNAATDPSFARKAAVLGAELRAREGSAAAAEMLEGYVRSGSQPP